MFRFKKEFLKNFKTKISGHETVLILTVAIVLVAAVSVFIYIRDRNNYTFQFAFRNSPTLVDLQNLPQNKVAIAEDNKVTIPNNNVQLDFLTDQPNKLYSVNLNGTNITFASPDFSKKNTSSENNNVTLTSQDNSVTIKYAVFDTYLKEEIILNNSSAKKTFNFSLDVDAALDLRKDENGGIYANKDNAPLFYISPPVVYDANNKEIGYELDFKKIGNQINLTLSPKSEADFANVTYPVTIDPTITWVFNSDATYTLSDPTKIEVVGGVVRLKNNAGVYATDNPYVITNSPIAFATLSTFTQVLGGGNQGTVQYQLSKDGTNWYWWNGSTWVTASGYAQSNLAVVISTNITAFSTQFGTGSLYVKAYLNTSSSSTGTELASFSVSYTGTLPAPTLTQVNPVSGAHTGGNTVTLTGTNFNNSWPYRKKITIDETKIPGTQSLQNFTVLVSMTDANLKYTANGGHVGKSNGGDIKFTLADGVTKLNHELEKYVPSTGEIIAWVTVPILSASANTDLYMQYGNAAAADQANSTGTWGTRYGAVWHLTEVSHADSFPGSAIDSTKWGLFGGTISVANNNLTVNTAAAQWSVGGVSSVGKWTLKGDFDIEVDYDAGAWGTPSGDEFDANLQLYSSGQAFYYIMSYSKGSSTRYYRTYQNETNTNFGQYQAAGTLTAGKLRFVRVGSTITAWQLVNGVTPQAVGSFTGAHTAEDMSVVLYAQNRTTGVALSGLKFANFKINGGELVRDSTTNVNNGTDVSTGTTTSGKFGSAKTFNGSSSFISLPYSSSLDLGAQDFTLDTWVNSTQAQASGVYPAILSNVKSGPASGYVLHLMAATGFKTTAYIDVWTADTQYQLASNVNVRDGAWHHLVATKTASEIKIYVDGILKNTMAYANGAATSNLGLQIGRQPGGLGYLSGSLDELRIHKSAVSESWVTAEFNNGNSPSTFYSVSAELPPIQVLFDGVNGTAVSVTNSTTLTAVVPAHLPGTVDVTVVNSDGQTATLAGGYTYAYPDGSPDRVVILGTAQSIVAGNKSTVITIEARNNLDIAANVVGDTTISLSSNSTGVNKAFYAVTDNTCSSIVITSVVMTDGTSQAQFCYYDEKASAPTWTLTASKSLPATPAWTSSAQDITVNPAALESFTVSLASPQRNRVAFISTNTITALDSFGNIKTNFDASANTVTLTASPVGLTIAGLSGVSTNLLSLAGDFTNGVANLSGRLSVITATPGIYTFTAASTDAKTGTSGDVQVSAGVLHHFDFSLTSPQLLDVGFSGVNTLTARDQENNLISDFNAAATNVTITENAAAGTVSGLGSAQNNILDQAEDFVAGVANLANNFKYNGPLGNHVFVATAGAITGTSGSVNFGSGQLAKFGFNLNSPQQNDQYFSLASISAQDISGNIVTGFNASSNNVTLSVSPSGTLAILGQPTLILNQAADFTNGVANLNNSIKFSGLVGEYTITATSASGSVGSADVTITAGNLASVKIVDAAGANANEVTTHNLTIDTNLTLWAASYDVSGNFIGNVTGSWASTGSLDSFTATAVNTAQFAPETANTTGTITFNDGAGHTDATGTVSVDVGNPISFSVVIPANATAGVPFSPSSIIARDRKGNIATAYSGSRTLTLSGAANGPQAGSPTTSITCSFTAGQMTSCSQQITLVKAEMVGITFTDGAASGESNEITNVGTTVTHLKATAPLFANAGVPFGIEITAQDEFGNTSPTYVGTQTLSFSGAGDAPSEASPTYATSAEFIDGVATNVLVTLVKTEEITLTVEIENLSATTELIRVLPGAAGSIVYISGNNQTAEINHYPTLPMVVEVKDIFGNIKNDYELNFVVVKGNGSIIPTSSTTDSFGRAQANFLLGSDAGVNSDIAEARAPGATGSPVIFYASTLPSTANTLQVTTPSSAIAGTPFNLTITAVDSAGNVATSYNGIKTVSYSGASNGPKTGIPIYTTSVEFENGVANSIPTTLVKVETIAITANITTENLSGVSDFLPVVAGETTNFEVIAPEVVQSGIPFNLISLKTLDQFGNYSTDFNSLKSISYSGAGQDPVSGNSPEYTTGVTFEDGIATSTIETTLYKAEVVSLKLQNLSVEGTSNPITVSYNEDYVLYYVSGNNQTGIVGQELSEPLVVRVLDKNGAPASALTVNFVAASNNGDTDPTNAEVNVSNGNASTNWTLDSHNTGGQTVIASVTDISNTITFQATALSANAVRLHINQTNIVTQVNVATTIISTCLQDQYGNNVAANANTHINLSSSAGASGQFATDAGGPWTSTSLIIPTGQSCINFYYKDAIAGFKNITTSSSGLAADSVSVNVQAATPVSLVIIPNIFTINVDNTQQLIAIAYDEFSNPIANVSVVWSMMNDLAGTVDANGLFTPSTNENIFTDAIKAAFSGLSAFATVTVTSDPVPTSPPTTITTLPTATVAVSPTTTGGTVTQNPPVLINLPETGSVPIDVGKDYFSDDEGTGQIDVNVSNRPIILSPSPDSLVLDTGNGIPVSGTAQPNKIIVIVDLNRNILASTTSDNDGNWSVYVGTDKRSANVQTLFARVYGTQLESGSLTFNIREKTLFARIAALLNM